MFISPWLGWIYNTGNKVKCRRFKRAGSWTFKVSLNRLGTSKCLLIYSCVCGGVVVFCGIFCVFFVPLSGIFESDEGDFQYYYAGNLSVLSTKLQQKKIRKKPQQPMPKLYFFPFALWICSFKTNLKTPANQIKCTNCLCWIFLIALHFSISGTWMKDKRADSTSVTFHLPWLQVAVVSLYPELSSLGTCYKFAKCSLFSDCF